MDYLVVLCHPDPRSFNSAIANAVTESLREAGKTYAVRDLYRMKFNPVLSAGDLARMKMGQCAEDVRVEREHVKSSETLVFISPVICNSIPAMLKGYFDRVMSLGFAMRIEHNRPVPLLCGKKAVVFTTSHSADELCREYGLYEALRNSIDVPLRSFCGIETLEHIFFTSVPIVSDDERKQMLEKTRMIMKNLAAQNTAK
jgi:NAD(P)H dehydrogenase (quinone)